MVYRGKPSAGCENCRKAKKRCGLEQPACQRCVKLKKVCSGYRDTTQLQIQDESETVRLKAKRQRIRSAATFRIEHGLPTPRTIPTVLTPHSDSASPSEGLGGRSVEEAGPPFEFRKVGAEDRAPLDSATTASGTIPRTLKQDADELATTYFFTQFTDHSGHWYFLREHAGALPRSRLLSLAIRACGMAALDNIQPVTKGCEYSRALYTEAITQLNADLRDPIRSRTDESLMAVAMLGYYENLTCDSRQSVQFWKAHINGSSQLLKIRGKEQLKSPTGRMLFRELRAQIVVNHMWEDSRPPRFLADWEETLQALSPEKDLVGPGDRLSTLSYRFAMLRYDMLQTHLADASAMERANKVETDMIQWSIDSMTKYPGWAYREVEVRDSPHVWNGTVQAYYSSPVATVWNNFRSLRIMLTRTQELICRRVGLSGDEEAAQLAYFRSVREQMAHDICGSIPSQLGHASPAPNSKCIIITAYSSIWPIFFATSCVFERISYDVWNEMLRPAKRGMPETGSAAYAQAAWLLSRLEYISKHVGLRWADGVAATLRGDFYHVSGQIPEDSALPMWLEEVGRSGRGPRVLCDVSDTPEPALDGQKSPISLGRAAGDKHNNG